MSGSRSVIYSLARSLCPVVGAVRNLHLLLWDDVSWEKLNCTVLKRIAFLRKAFDAVLAFIYCIGLLSE